MEEVCENVIHYVVQGSTNEVEVYANVNPKDVAISLPTNDVVITNAKLSQDTLEAYQVVVYYR